VQVNTTHPHSFTLFSAISLLLKLYQLIILILKILGRGVGGRVMEGLCMCLCLDYYFIELFIAVSVLLTCACFVYRYTYTNYKIDETPLPPESPHSLLPEILLDFHLDTPCHGAHHVPANVDLPLGARI
jgi:hypothetical protein